MTHNDLPSFGWRMVGRLNADAFTPSIASVQWNAIYAAIGLLTILGAATLIYARIFIQPIVTLATSASEIVEGSDAYPPFSNVTRETAELSDALAQLQELRPALPTAS